MVARILYLDDDGVCDVYVIIKNRTSCAISINGSTVIYYLLTSGIEWKEDDKEKVVEWNHIFVYTQTHTRMKVSFSRYKRASFIFSVFGYALFVVK